MQPELIILSEYCLQTQVEPSFIKQLENEGLIDIQVREGQQYIFTSQLTVLERYTRLYYDLSINMAGIDAITHLLERVTRLRREVDFLKQQLKLYENNEPGEDIPPTMEGRES